MELEGSFIIYPFQEFKAEFLPPSPFAKPNPVVYGQPNEYPGDLVISVGESYICGSSKIAHLLIFPLQYVPKSKKLYLFKSITFTLSLAKERTDVPEIRARSKTSQKSCDIHVRESVINPNDVDTYKVSPIIILDKSMEIKPLHLGNIPVNIGTDPSDYIIITSDTTMVDAFMPLAEWRVKKGILTEIFTMPWIESNYIGADIQEKIKNFIYDCFANRGTRHVLLGGNSDLVPVRYSYIYHYEKEHNGEAATDLYYSNCTVGAEAWEIHEGPKSPTPHITYNPPEGHSIDALLPRVNLGRLLVANEDQTRDIINKILTYERDVPAMDYHKSFLFHGADDGGRIGYVDFVDPAIPDYLRSNTRTLIADGADADGQSTPENIISFMTGGSDLGVPFNFLWSWGHGNPWALATNSAGFTGNHIEQIINLPRFNGSFYAWACTSAPIGYIDPTLLAAKWVNLPNGGGLGWLGSSIIAGGDQGVWHARYYHEEMWGNSQDYHHHNIGRAFAEAKTRMIENFPDPPCNPLDPPWLCRWREYHAIIWNLVGDPMVPLFNHTPRTMDVMVSPQMVEPDIATTLSITVEDDGDPVESALVCMIKSDENVYLTDYMDAHGECQFDLPPLSIAGNIDVTVTKYNHRPYKATIQVSGKSLLCTPVTPCRIVDTRKTSTGIINASTERDFHVYGDGATINAQGGNFSGCSAPMGEPLAAHINMIAVNPTGKGNLQAYPVGAGIGAGLSVNYNAIDTNLANDGTVKTVTGSGPDITVASNFSSAHTVIDVLGYYYPDEGFYYTPVDPCRVDDTRKTSAGIIDAGTERDLRVYGPVGDQGGNAAGCPSTLGVTPRAAHLNMIAVDPTGKGNLQAFPADTGTGAGLSVNYNTIDTNLANAGTVKTSPDITVASNFSSAHTVIDVLGYYSEEEDLLYTPVKPCRIVDTRKTSSSIINANTQRDFRVFGPVGDQGGDSDGCPSPRGNPLAAHLNMVAVNPTGKGNLQAFPVGAGAGAGMSVNYNTIDTNLANAGTVKTVTGTGANITVASNFASAHTVIDVLGYYYPAP